MSAKKSTTHTLIEGELTIALRERSSVWQCRYCIDGKWQRNTTNERDIKKAKERAKDIYKEAIWKQKNNVAPITRFFRDIAKVTVKRLQAEIDSGSGKAIYKDYITAIDTYLIPILGKYKVDSIDYKALEYLNVERIKKMNSKRVLSKDGELKVPTKSTLLTHNAALNRVFDLAIEKGYMTLSSKPNLIAKGKASERRDEFTEEEVRALRGNFEQWIDRGRADAKPVRALLRDYVEVLLDTGARAGKELLDLKWVQIQLNYEPKSLGKTKTSPTEDNQHGKDIEAVDLQRLALIRIETGKTGKRTAIGRAETVVALGRIAHRNYKKPLATVIEENPKDYIFRFIEYLNDDEKRIGKKPKFIKPTSFVKLFNTYLEEHSLLYHPVSGKKRQPYSLRHTYATLMLTYDKVPPHTLAKQMGTSIGMLEKHYSHLEAIKAINQLRGEESRQLIQVDKSVAEKYAYKEKVKGKK